jgi:hypothetical protein
MSIFGINSILWERFAQANKRQGLTIHRTLEKLIAVWIDVYGNENEPSIDRKFFTSLPTKPDFMDMAQGKKLVNKKLKEIRK